MPGQSGTVEGWRAADLQYSVRELGGGCSFPENTVTEATSGWGDAVAWEGIDLRGLTAYAEAERRPTDITSKE